MRKSQDIGRTEWKNENDWDKIENHQSKKRKVWLKDFEGLDQIEKHKDRFMKILLTELKAIVLYESIKFFERQGNTKRNNYGESKRYKNIN